MRIGLITAVWRRPALTAVFWRWTEHLREWWSEHELVCCVAGSEEDHQQMAADAGARWAYVPNQKGIGAKFNAACRLAEDTDAILVMGSDDVFCERVARRLRWHFKYGGTYLGFKDCYYYHVRDGRVGYFPGYWRPARLGEPTGMGRVVPASMMDSLQWKLWAETPQMDKRFKHHGADHGSFRRLLTVAEAHPPLLDIRALGGTALSLKSEENLWAFEHTHPSKAPDNQTAMDVLGRLPDDLVGEILALRETAVMA